MLVASFTFYSLQLLDKNGQYHYSNTGLDLWTSFFKEIIAFMFIVEKKYT